MKSYLFSIVAMAIAIIAFSFTVSEEERRTTYDFRFAGSVYSKASVEDENNWYQFAGSPECDGENCKACEILDVAESYTELVGGVRKMKSTVDIKATLCVITYYVSSVNSGSANNNSFFGE